RARQYHHTALQRFTKRRERVAVELRQLVEEQYTQMRQRKFAGPQGAAANERCGRRGMLWTSKRPAAAEGGLATRRRFETRHLQRFVAIERRQQAWQALREQGLARPRWPDHQHPVSAGCRDLQGALCAELTTHI